MESDPAFVFAKSSVVFALTMGLSILEEVQKLVSGKVPGAIPSDDEFPTKDAVRTYTLALIVEIAEWVQEIDHKPWKNANTEASLKAAPAVVAEEFADILAFLGVLICYMEQWGITPHMLAEAYFDKSLTNVKRIKEQLGGA